MTTPRTGLGARTAMATNSIASSLRHEVESNAFQILAHPKFDAALYRFTTDIPAAFSGRLVANRAIGETARFAMVAMIVHLDHVGKLDSRGATAARLIELLAMRRLASATRAKAMIAYMVAQGLLHALPVPGDARATRLVPTNMLLTQMRTWLAAHFGAAATIHDFGVSPAVLAADPGMLTHYLVGNVEAYRSGFILSDGFVVVQTLMAHAAGYRLLMRLVRDARTEGDGIITAAPPAEIAQRVGVTPAHVRKLFRLCADAGWLTPLGRGGKVRLSPGFHEEGRRWVATEIAWDIRLASTYRASCEAASAPD